jgi:hypothetical protein
MQKTVDNVVAKCESGQDQFEWQWRIKKFE